MSKGTSQDDFIISVIIGTYAADAVGERGINDQMGSDCLSFVGCIFVYK